jgi:peptidoglycan/LPS O-acetylase OafA/YrhL
VVLHALVYGSAILVMNPTHMITADGCKNTIATPEEEQHRFNDDRFKSILRNPAFMWLWAELPFFLFMLIIFVTAAFSIETTYYFAVGNVTTMFTGLILFMLLLYKETGVAASILSFSPVYYLGKVSYCFYLTHPLVGAYIGDAVKSEHPGAYAGIFFFTTLGVSSLLHHCIQNPMHKLIVSNSVWRCSCKHQKQLHQ